MGVGGKFWDILKPHARHEGYGYLRNKWVAVDLSYWIVQNETAVRKRTNHVQNPHIRLTFFRTINLFSKFGAFPVFVVDGTPSPLKSQARIARFFQASGIHLSKSPAIEDDVSPERNKTFTKYVKECVELLKLLGIPVLQANGEAEALCAQLNREGHVVACITADSDAFLYGANCVIKAIHPNCKEPIECYHMTDIEAGLGLKRKQLIAIGLLVGNDHNLNGVKTIGIESAIRFVKCYNEEEILDRLVEIENCVSDENAKSTLDPLNSLVDASPKPRQYHCSLCGHPGTRKAHLKSPCSYCKTDNGQGCIEKAEAFKCNCLSCNEHRKRKEQKRLDIWQQKICNKIASETNSPNHKIMEMYLSESHGSFDEINGPCWEKPKIELLIEFLVIHQNWEPSYIRQKLLIMLSTIYLREVAAKKAKILLHKQYEFDSIQRIKTRYGHQFYVVKWRKSAQNIIVFDENCASKDFSTPQDIDECDDVYDEPVIHVDDGECFLLTDEDMDLVKAAFPEEVDRFLWEKELKESKVRKTPKRDGVELDSVAKARGLQLCITEFYKSTKPQYQDKSEDDSTNISIDDLKGKRKNNTPSLSKSVRRRLLFN